jgi:hypothetical protein
MEHLPYRPLHSPVPPPAGSPQEYEFFRRQLKGLDEGSSSVENTTRVGDERGNDLHSELSYSYSDTESHQQLYPSLPLPFDSISRTSSRLGIAGSVCPPPPPQASVQLGSSSMMLDYYRGNNSPNQSLAPTSAWSITVDPATRPSSRNASIQGSQSSRLPTKSPTQYSCEDRHQSLLKVDTPSNCNIRRLSQASHQQHAELHVPISNGMVSPRLLIPIIDSSLNNINAIAAASTTTATAINNNNNNSNINNNSNSSDSNALGMASTTLDHPTADPFVCDTRASSNTLELAAEKTAELRQMTHQELQERLLAIAINDLADTPPATSSTSNAAAILTAAASAVRAPSPPIPVSLPPLQPPVHQRGRLSEVRRISAGEATRVAYTPLANNTVDVDIFGVQPHQNSMTLTEEAEEDANERMADESVLNTPNEKALRRLSDAMEEEIVEANIGFGKATGPPIPWGEHHPGLLDTVKAQQDLFSRTIEERRMDERKQKAKTMEIGIGTDAMTVTATTQTEDVTPAEETKQEWIEDTKDQAKETTPLLNDSNMDRQEPVEPVKTTEQSTITTTPPVDTRVWKIFEEWRKVTLPGSTAGSTSSLSKSVGNSTIPWFARNLKSDLSGSSDEEEECNENVTNTRGEQSNTQDVKLVYKSMTHSMMEQHGKSAPYSFFPRNNLNNSPLDGANTMSNSLHQSISDVCPSTVDTTSTAINHNHTPASQTTDANESSSCICPVHTSANEQAVDDANATSTTTTSTVVADTEEKAKAKEEEEEKGEETTTKSRSSTHRSSNNNKSKSTRRSGKKSRQSSSSDSATTSESSESESESDSDSDSSSHKVTRKEKRTSRSKKSRSKATKKNTSSSDNNSDDEEPKKKEKSRKKKEKTVSKKKSKGKQPVSSSESEDIEEEVEEAVSEPISLPVPPMRKQPARSLKSRSDIVNQNEGKNNNLLLPSSAALRRKTMSSSQATTRKSRSTLELNVETKHFGKQLLLLHVVSNM